MRGKPDAIQVKIKRISGSYPLPSYNSPGAVGFDFYCVHDSYVHPGQIILIATDVIMEVPEGYMLMIVPRSSTARNVGVTMPNGVGVIDNDYRGENDQIFIQVYNFTNEERFIQTGSKIAQGILVKVAHADFCEVSSMAEVSRGGFGSTDKK